MYIKISTVLKLKGKFHNSDFLQLKKKNKNCLQVLFKERIAHDMSTQLRILLNEALEINPSAFFSPFWTARILGYL